MKINVSRHSTCSSSGQHGGWGPIPIIGPQLGVADKLNNSEDNNFWRGPNIDLWRKASIGGKLYKPQGLAVITATTSVLGKAPCAVAGASVLLASDDASGRQSPHGIQKKCLHSARCQWHGLDPDPHVTSQRNPGRRISGPLPAPSEIRAS
jgi:hypothetical protein